jgi:uncharacterized protein YjbJ (UPF0337 family)
MSETEKLKGKAKEAVGGLTGSDSLREEGQAQQLKAEEELRAAEARQRAERHERRAEEHARAEAERQGT